MLLYSAVTGCGVSHPYYTLEGNTESRVVVIHIDEDTSEKIPCGSGMGAGLTGGMKTQMASGEPVTIEKGSARVTLTAKEPFFVVSKVEYDGQEVRYHEPLW